MNIDSDRLNTLLVLLVETIRTTRPMTLSNQQELVTEEGYSGMLRVCPTFLAIFLNPILIHHLTGKVLHVHT